jgi:hypothetical protein
MLTDSYKDRTWFNVASSDVTIRFFTVEWSAGEKCTLNAIKACNKPYFDVNLFNLNDETIIFQVWQFINNIDRSELIINIAGNSEQTSKGICKSVTKLLLEIFSMFQPDFIS